MVATTERLGISRTTLAEAIRPQAERFVEHVLADAKSDGRLTEKEEGTLAALVDKLELSLPFCEYVEQHVGALRTIRQAALVNSHQSVLHVALQSDRGRSFTIANLPLGSRNAFLNMKYAGMSMRESLR